MFRSLLILCLLLPLTARAGDSAQLPLAPPSAQVSVRAYGLGVLPLDGNFTRFDGVVAYDPNDRGVCRVTLRVDVASLEMSDAALRNEVVGPDFMDAAQFPTLHFAGTCRPSSLGGVLAMHGVTRPLSLALAWDGDTVTAEGRVRRADWGMTARRFFGGSTVRITVRMTLPPIGSAGKEPTAVQPPVVQPPGAQPTAAQPPGASLPGGRF